MIEHNVLIEKDPMVKIARNAVNPAELVVLNRIHPAGSVQVRESYELDEDLAEQFDPEAEYTRLMSRYAPRGGDEPLVARLFPGGPADIAAVCGVDYRPSGRSTVREQSVVQLGDSRRKGERKVKAKPGPKPKAKDVA